MPFLPWQPSEHLPSLCQPAGMCVVYMCVCIWVCTFIGGQRPEKDTGGPACSNTFSLISLRQGYSLNWEQGWQPGNTSEPPVSTHSSTGLTGICVATPRFLERHCGFEFKFSCFHSKCSHLLRHFLITFHEFVIGLCHVNYQISGNVGTSKMSDMSSIPGTHTNAEEENWLQYARWPPDVFYGMCTITHAHIIYVNSNNCQNTIQEWGCARGILSASQ